MKYFIKSMAVAAILLFAVQARSQQVAPPAAIAPQQEQPRTDSLQRMLMRDSLNLSESVINQVVALQHSYDSAARQIIQHPATGATQQTMQLRALQRQTTEAIRELMGAAVYEHYVRILMGQ